MAQQDNTQAQAASATTTEAGFTLFTHLARAPEIHQDDVTQRRFCGSWLPVSAGNHSSVMRWENKTTAELQIESYGKSGGIWGELRTELTADQCESLARALLDAAHDLRTHSANQLMVNTILEMTEGGAA